jgi:hypothetical protein|uniref:Uncharacterized protein n=1 Tax=viral metagenome TaxID=1070528 RepID=A0A6C0DTG4_9ZZZZ
MKYLDFLDEIGPLTIPLIINELPEKPTPTIVERFVDFIDELFDNLFWKSYYENIKKNN